MRVVGLVFKLLALLDVMMQGRAQDFINGHVRSSVYGGNRVPLPA